MFSKLALALLTAVGLATSVVGAPIPAEDLAVRVGPVIDIPFPPSWKRGEDMGRNHDWH